jgi:GTP-binding nuclear protein Ran
VSSCAWDDSGRIKINLWDPTGAESNPPLRSEFYEGADCAIIMFFHVFRMSYKNVAIWYREFTQATNLDLPVVLVTTQIDIKDRKIMPKHIMFHHKKRIPICEISSLANFRVEVPLTLLARKMLRDDTLEVTNRGTIGHPTKILDKLRLKNNGSKRI